MLLPPQKEQATKNDPNSVTVNYDAIVLGLGGVGSSTLFHLAASGVNVLGIERFQLVHSRGSSHGETRAIRKAYFEHPSYVPLIQRSYDNWRALEERCGKQLLFEQGLIEIGPPEGPLISGLERACEAHRLALHEIAEPEFSERFPGFHLPVGYKCLFEPDGGYLLVEPCVEAYCQAAMEGGAKIVSETKVLSWKVSDGQVRVSTDRGDFQAGKLVITAGAWTSQILSTLGLGLTVLRKHLHWYSVPRGAYSALNGSPVFFYESPGGYYYGFPCIDSDRRPWIKIAEHSFGEAVDNPDSLSGAVDQEERVRVEEFLRNFLGFSRPTPRKHEVCMYTMSPDGQFIVDRHPNHSQVFFATGLSGHGFKFASVLGEVLSDLAVYGQSKQDLAFLSLDRFRPRI